MESEALVEATQAFVVPQDKILCTAMDKDL